MSSLVEYFLLRVLYLHENFHKGMKKNRELFVKSEKSFYLCSRKKGTVQIQGSLGEWLKPAVC